jgi:hypothetical protein
MATSVKNTLTPVSERKLSKSGKPRSDKTDWQPALNSHKVAGVSSREVSAFIADPDTDESVEIRFTERKLVKVDSKDLAAAASLLKLKAKQALTALEFGARKLARVRAVREIKTIAAMAEEREISIEEARKRYYAK